MDFTDLKNTLEKHRFKVCCFDTKEAAADYLDAQIDGKTVAFGGSVTLAAMGLKEKLGAHNTVIWHWFPAEGKSRGETLAEAAHSDIYIASANALAMTGEIVNIDGGCNRITSLVYGHGKVYYVIGRNKITANVQEAMDRARNIASPINAKRLGRKTPCAAEGTKCYDCNSPERICNTMTITWRPSFGVDVEILLVDEDLGF